MFFFKANTDPAFGFHLYSHWNWSGLEYEIYFFILVHLELWSDIKIVHNFNKMMKKQNNANWYIKYRSGYMKSTICQTENCMAHLWADPIYFHDLSVGTLLCSELQLTPECIWHFCLVSFNTGNPGISTSVLNNFIYSLKIIWKYVFEINNGPTIFTYEKCMCDFEISTYGC